MKRRNHRKKTLIVDVSWLKYASKDRTGLSDPLNWHNKLEKSIAEHKQPKKFRENVTKLIREFVYFYVKRDGLDFGMNMKEFWL